ncbi:hypothetical protein [Blastococcus xanthinilyticus]|uniref:Uncharacterized protein n=1 Tax=Blastococcus xanthinilyticus TaxID=1564164 RepID=A0A5S5CZW3_9ACTN|nr:hypothetical protein [Blastococcus xanthinilyticus]TYP88548.1 hypothetical protein BD833_104256 [Blastococcus xanthinilyticus]
MSSLPRRRRPAAALLLPAVLALAGCGWLSGEGPAGSPEERTAGTRADIERELTARDGVTAAEVRYRDDLTVSATAAVDVTVEPDADAEATYDEALRLVWDSDLAPLDVIAVSVIDPADPPSGISRTVNLLDEVERDAVEDELGPRAD